LISKGENFGSKQGENKYFPKGSNFDSKRGEKKRKWGQAKGKMDLGGDQVIIG